MEEMSNSWIRIRTLIRYWHEPVKAEVNIDNPQGRWIWNISKDDGTGRRSLAVCMGGNCWVAIMSFLNMV